MGFPGILKRTWEFTNREMTPRDNFYCIWGYYPEESPYREIKEQAERAAAAIAARRAEKETEINRLIAHKKELRRRISLLTYSSVDQGDDPDLRREANERIDAMIEHYGFGNNPRRVTWNCVYDIISEMAVVDFRRVTKEFIDKKIAAGEELSPTGYPWTWLNLAVSNDYWKSLLRSSIEIAETEIEIRKRRNRRDV